MTSLDQDLKRLNNIKIAYDKAEDKKMRTMWHNKWYELVKEISEKISKLAGSIH
jgi:uncharacterized protein YaaR (DUF327 family)